MGKRDLFGRDTLGHELLLDVGVEVEAPASGDPAVGKDKLEVVLFLVRFAKSLGSGVSIDCRNRLLIKLPNLIDTHIALAFGIILSGRIVKSRVHGHEAPIVNNPQHVIPDTTIHNVFGICPIVSYPFLQDLLESLGEFILPKINRNRFAPDQIRSRYAKLLGGPDVHVLPHQSHQLRDVHEFREAARELESAALRRVFGFLPHHPEGVGPGVESGYPEALQLSWVEIPGNVEELSHGIG